MKVIKGPLKLQYGNLYVHEMLEPKSAILNNPVEIAGYAIYDLQHQRLGRFCRFFNDVIAEAENILKLGHLPKDLMAA